MNAEEATPVETLYIGDSPEDWQAAHSLTVHFIGVDSGRGLRCKTLYTDFYDILQYINSIYDC
jgi:phosphoglycolate phosphatase-like HAD superfamily hydrolase